MVWWLLASAVAAGPLVAQQETTKESAPTPSASLQQQIDDLKAGQERILRELDELKRLLRQRPNRPDLPSSPLPPENISLGVHGEPFRGDRQARVAIMEYSDFDCSFCSRYALEILPRIDADYIKTGKVKYYFRDLPAPEHTNSLFKARAARCIGEQGRFWEIHDWLFAHRAPLNDSELDQVLKTMDLDAAAVHECLDNGRYAEAIQRSVVGARRIGIRGTPAFLVGTMSQDGDTIQVTKVMLGAESYETIKSVLDELISGAENE